MMLPGDGEPHKKTILLVEDEALIALDTAQLLKDEGYDVLLAYSGEKAIAAAAANPKIDLILMDIDLGRGMDGTEAAQTILATREIPVVFLSSHTEKDIVDRIEKITSYGYVVKYSGETVLLASIRMAFRLYDAHRDIAYQRMELQASDEELRVLVRELQGTNENLIRSEQQLTARERLLGTTGRMSRTGGWEFDVATGQGTWTDEVARIHGLDPSASTGAAFGLSFYSGESGRKIEEAVKAAISEGKPYDLELELVSAAGVRKWVRSIGEPVFEGSKVVRVQGTFQDITDRKKAEQALMEGGGRYRMLFERTTDAVFVYGPDSEGKPVRPLDANPAARSLSGFTLEELLGTPSGRGFPFSGEDFERLEALPSGGVRTNLFRKDGAPVPVIVSAYTLESMSGRILFLIASREDRFLSGK